MQKHETSEPIPELGNRTWEELEVIEDGEQGYLLFKDQIRKRVKDGTFEAIEVRVRVPRPQDHGLARSTARRWFAKLELDPDRDAQMFSDFEQVCLLARAIRTAKAPHAQFAGEDELSTQFDEASLQDLLGRVQIYKRLLDPRGDDSLTEEQVFEKIVAIARRRHLGPLADMPGPAQDSCVLRMAEEACRSPRVLSWLQSRETSTPAPSPASS